MLSGVYAGVIFFGGFPIFFYCSYHPNPRMS